MAEVTKRKIGVVYSIIAGFFLSLFGHNAHAGEIFYKMPRIESTQTQQQGNTTSNLTTRQLMAPAPTTSTLKAAGLMTPAPSDTTTTSQAPATEIQTATDIQDVGMKNFVIEQATAAGKNPDQLSSSDLNTFRTQYLLQQIKLLQQKVDELQ